MTKRELWLARSAREYNKTKTPGEEEEGEGEKSRKGTKGLYVKNPADLPGNPQLQGSGQGPTATQLAQVWRKHFAGKPDQPILTAKNLGQLKYILASLGSESLPAIEFALKNWGTFAWEVRLACGLQGVPDSPEIFFVCQHWDVLIRIMRKAQAPKDDWAKFQEARKLALAPEPKKVIAE